MSDKRPTIRVVLYKSKVLSNGEYPIMLVVSYNGTRKYKSLGVSCKEKDWNEEKGEVKKTHPQARLINNTITAKITEVTAQYLEFEKDNRQYSASTLLKTVKKSAPSTKTLFTLFEERVTYFRTVTKTNNTADGYNTLNSAFKRYLNNHDVELFLIDEEWITKFEIWLREHYKDTSIKKFFDCFKAAMNYAVRKKYIEKSPLDNYEHIKPLNLETAKRALSMAEITKLTQYYIDSYGFLGEKTKPVEEKTKTHYWNKWFKRRGTTKLTPIDAEQLSLALFLCSYYFQGLALVDLAKIKWRDMKEIEIRDNNIYAYNAAKYGQEYADKNTEVKECYQLDIERSKTGKPVKIIVEKSIVTPYLNPFIPDGITEDEEMKDMYVFPIYSPVDDTEHKRYSRMKYAIYLVNVNIKRVGEALGINDLTFYSARHTYASNLYHAEVPMTLIAQNMGRSPAEIETYLKAFDNLKILEANEKALVTGNKAFKKGLKDKPKDEETIAKRREYAAKKSQEGKTESEESVKKRMDELEAALQERFNGDINAMLEYLRGNTLPQ